MATILRFFVIVAMLASSTAAFACKMGKETPEGVPSFLSCPQGVKEVLVRAIGCQHFGGELGGDGSARDKQVNAQVMKMRCDMIEHDILALKKKYKADSSVQKTIKETYQAYGIE